MSRLLHILVLTDEVWTHPRADDTSAVLRSHVMAWAAAGHTVTILAPGPEQAIEEPLPDGLTIRFTRSTHPVTGLARAVRRGAGGTPDVVLEVFHGRALMTPLWWFLRAPVVVLALGALKGLDELSTRERLLELARERLALRGLYGDHEFLATSNAMRTALIAAGIEPAHLHVHYPGVDAARQPPLPEAPDPALVHAGPLTDAQGVALVLDVLTAVPGSSLDVIDTGDDARTMEVAVAARSLGDRVTIRGDLSRQRRLALYDQAWLLLTRSPLAALEAATRGTPTVAVRSRELAETVVDGATGVLAETDAALPAAVKRVVDDPDLRRRLGAQARARARGFTSEEPASASLSVLEHAAAGHRTPLRGRLLGSDTGKAAALASATLLNNAIQLMFTVAVTRILGTSGYGALAAIISAFLIMYVTGQSVQAAAAREVALGRLGDHHQLRATLDGWTRTILLSTIVFGAIGVLTRQPLADLIGVPEHPWAVAALLPSGALWMWLSLQRGVLQGLHAFRPIAWSLVGEAGTRMVIGIALAATVSVTGAFLATPACFLMVSIWLTFAIDRRLGSPAKLQRRSSLRSLVGDGWVPVLGLVLLAILQNIDVIIARHQLGHDRAGSYAVAAVAAKTCVWVAIGVGLQVLPQAARNAASGLDPRPVLSRALLVLAAVAVPAAIVLTIIPRFVLGTVFGPDTEEAAGALAVLAIAMTLLAVTYLTVQYMIALGHTGFLWVLALTAGLEIATLSSAGEISITDYALVVFAAQVLAAFGVLLAASRINTARGGSEQAQLLG